MSRGFNATFGTATTDRIVSANTTTPASLSIAIWAFRNGDGGDGFGAFCETASERVIFGNWAANDAFRFFRIWSGADGTWRAPRGTAGEWHHYCVTYAGTATTNNPIMYLDGVSQVVTQEGVDPSGTVDTTASAWWIGNRVADQSKCWDGLLSRFGLWSIVLTQDQVTNLAAGASPEIYPTGLIEHIETLGTTTPRSTVTTNPTVTGALGNANDAPTRSSFASPIGLGIFRT